MCERRTIFERITIHDACPKETLISINSSTSVADGVKVLGDHMIISVPVIDGNKCIGVVDIVDILNYLFKQVKNIEEWLSNSPASVYEVFSGVSVKELLDFAHGDPLVISSEESSIQSIIKFFISGWSHRCIVKTTHGFTILTQFDVIKMIANAMRNDKKLFELFESIVVLDRLNSRSITDETVTIGSTANVFEALERMVTKQVHALAVVDEIEDGKIIGNFSASDLLNLQYAQFKDLALSVRDFLEKYSPTSLNPVTVEAGSTSLATVLNLFAELGVHRVWIVDCATETTFPLGVITLTDVLHIVDAISLD